MGTSVIPRVEHPHQDQKSPLSAKVHHFKHFLSNHSPKLSKRKLLHMKQFNKLFALHDKMYLDIFCLTTYGYLVFSAVPQIVLV